jgi:putative membrane protein
MHPNPEQHEFMDRMMWWEGSIALKTRHIMMGSNYLWCLWWGIMGNMMMWWWMMTWNGYGMMGTNYWFNKGHFWLWKIFSFLKWGIIIFIIVFITIWFTKQKSSSMTALEILKTRYIKGKIDKKEYEEKKKDIL